MPPPFPLRTASWQNLVIVHASGAIARADVRRLFDTYREEIAKHRGGIVVGCFVERATDTLPDGSREEFASLVRQFGASIPRIAVLLAERETSAVVLRTIIRGYNVVARTSTYQIVLSELEMARSLAPVMSSIGGSPVSEEQVLAAIRRLRASIA